MPQAVGMDTTGMDTPQSVVVGHASILLQDRGRPLALSGMQLLA